MGMYNLVVTISELIKSAHEGEFWDFKEEHHSNKIELLHDILCLSNSIYKGDRYIIYGVTDNTYNIVGIKQDSLRRKQSDIIDFLRSQKFAGGYRPEIELRSIQVDSKEIDVLIIRNSVYTPFYITEDKRENDKMVRANYIYSRIGDTNTPIDRSADLHIVEKLWKNRFGLDLTPFERIKLLLSQPESWVIDLGNKNYAYHKQFPEFQLMFEESRKGYEPYCAFYTNPSAWFGKLNLLYHSTILYETEYWTGDEMRIYLPKACIRYVHGLNGKKYWYYYYELDSIEGKLLRLFTNEHLDCSSREGRCVQFLLFANKNESKSFEQYLHDNLDKIELTDISEFEYQIAIDKQEGGRVFSAESIARIYLMYQQWNVNK